MTRILPLRSTILVASTLFAATVAYAAPEPTVAALAPWMPADPPPSAAARRGRAERITGGVVLALAAVGVAGIVRERNARLVAVTPSLSARGGGLSLSVAF